MSMGSVRGRVAAVTVSALVLVMGCESTQPPDRAPAPTTVDRPAAAAPESAEVTGEPAVVVHVVDGDTLDAELANGVIERIRIPQIDTPERDECGYDDATWALEELVLGETVQLIPTAAGPGRDPYDRLLRAVEVDGADVGAALIRSGVARWVSRYADEDPRLAEMYREAEADARGDGRGFWSECGW